ncbi:hypothetical protein FQN57_004640 [Myotisia sp. PD_48]|nr:hypothetical protein FQN57_004640 [Myotisia sp. PD_48]
MAESLTRVPDSACPPSSPSRTLAPATSSSSSSVSFLAKNERNLTSIANAGLNITSTTTAADNKNKSRFLSPASMAAASSVRRGEEDRSGRRHSNDSQSTRAITPDAQMTDEPRDSPNPQSVQPPNQASRMTLSPDDARGEDPAHRASSAGVLDNFSNGDHSRNPPLIHTSTVASPGPIEEGSPMENRSQQRDDEYSIEGGGNKSFSYPVPMPAGGAPDPRRGMSLPHSASNKAGTRSPSTKKHKCPFCFTEFTRHHNLKSHLLTHSQEKPYICETCHSRFRRLHDLKRHSKLHTGERPHICPKCGRRFARGDALARHNKGPGGCAGRRSSMGGFGADEDYADGPAHGPVADDAMEGLIYTEPDRMDDEDERRMNLPGIKKTNPSSESHPQLGRGRHVSFQQSHHQSNTYPPLAASRSPQSSLYPPAPSHQGSGSSASPISQSGAHVSFPPSGGSGSSTFNPGQSGSSASMFAQTGMTESPKPLSPSGPVSRQLNHPPESNIRPSQQHHQQQPQQQQHMHSPNLKPHYQSLLSRNGAGVAIGHSVPFSNAPASGPGPSTGNSQGGSLSHQGSSQVSLPPPPGLNPPDSRFTLHSQASQQPPSLSASTMPHVSNRTSPHHSLPHPHHSHANSASEIGSAGNGYPSPHTDSNFSYFTSHHQYKSDQPQRQLSIPSPNSTHPPNDRIWGYVRSLEDRVNGLESEITRLRSQMESNNNNNTNTNTDEPKNTHNNPNINDTSNKTTGPASSSVSITAAITTPPTTNGA